MRFHCSLLLVLFSLVTRTLSLECYDTAMNKQECHPMQLWCVEWRNGSTVSRGCTDVNVCPDEEQGCYPLHDSKATERWCCCNEDLCNSSPTVFNVHFSYLFTVFLLVILTA